MQNKYISLGLMSGTSGDGVDASIIRSDGISQFESIKTNILRVYDEIYESIHNLKEKIHSKDDLEKYYKEISDLERKITIFHAKIVNELAEA